MIHWNCRIAYRSSQATKLTLKTRKPAAVEVGRLSAPAVEGPPSPGEPRAICAGTLTQSWTPGCQWVARIHLLLYKQRHVCRHIYLPPSPIHRQEKLYRKYSALSILDVHFIFT